MAQTRCAHVQEGWVRPKPAALTHFSAESAWHHWAQLSMQSVSQTILMVGTIGVTEACIAVFAHNIYPASCKSHLSLLLQTHGLVWKQFGSG